MYAKKLTAKETAYGFLAFALLSVGFATELREVVC